MYELIHIYYMNSSQVIWIHISVSYKFILCSMNSYLRGVWIHRLQIYEYEFIFPCNMNSYLRVVWIHRFEKYVWIHISIWYEFIGRRNMNSYYVATTYEFKWHNINSYFSVTWIHMPVSFEFIFVNMNSYFSIHKIILISF